MTKAIADQLKHPHTHTWIHPVFFAFERRSTRTDGRFMVDFLGVKTDPKFHEGINPSPVKEEYRPYYQSPDTEQYFEWITVLDSVLHADSRFVMMELGAARGSWLVRATTALRQLSDMPVHLVAVEGSEVRCGWIHEHFRDNDIDPQEHTIINGVVGPEDGFAYFLEAEDVAGAGYGDRVIAGGDERAFERIRQQFGMEKSGLHVGERSATSNRGQACVKVKSVSMSTLVALFEAVDLIHMDVQGAEYTVLSSAIEPVSEKVKVLCIGTHSAEVERQLRTLLPGHGWLPRYDFPRRSTWSTDWGTISFRDGCQVWINSRTAR